MSTAIVVPRSRADALGLTRKRQRRIFILAALGSDILMLALSFAIAYVIRFYSELPIFDDVVPVPSVQLAIMGVLLPTWIIVFALFNLYNIHYLLGGTDEYARVFNATAVVFALVIIATFFFPVVRISRGWLTIAAVTAFLLITLQRFILRRIVYRLRRHGFLTTRTLIIGTNEEARAIAHQFQTMPTAGAELIGFADNVLPVGSRVDGKLHVISTLDSLPTVVEANRVEEIVVSTSSLERQDLIRVFQMFGQSPDVELRLSSGLFEIFTTGVHVKEIGSVPLVSIKKFRLNGLEMAIKTVMDYLLTIALLLVLAPVMLAIAILIKFDSPGPIFHRRRVLGRGDRPFDAYKFRTMYVNGQEILAQHPELEQELAANQKLRNDPRVTPLGRHLRRYSLDELPQLFNVLKGQMSLVGPRMISPEEAQKYGRWRMNLLTVKPGITGLWQVSGRSDVSYEERIRFDMYYIRNYTIWLDLQILINTIPVVIRGRGAY